LKRLMTAVIFWKKSNHRDDFQMLTKSTMLHLRVPFSYFLLPTYLFALSCANSPVLWKTLLVFIILHLLLYPASNSYNSYYDRDTQSIGTLKHPLPVEKELLIVSLMLDAAAVLLGLFIGWMFAAAALFYGLASKAYSHNKIRIKKWPIVSLIGVGLTQGAFTFLMSYFGIQDILLTDMLNMRIFSGAVVSSLFITAAYPMTQIYQHKADTEHGDISFSMLLGIRGTFLFCAVCLAIAIIGFSLFFWHYYGVIYMVIFSLLLLPVGVFFFYWMVITFSDDNNANYDNTMRLNFLSSTALNAFMILILATH
jgi:4-hydroxybenzoate polyprenyltransferase